MRLLIPTLLILLVARPAQAYIGPGLGLGTIGAFFGAVLAGVLAFLGFLWYPFKRLLRKRRRQTDGSAGGGDVDDPSRAQPSSADPEDSAKR